MGKQGKIIGNKVTSKREIVSKAKGEFPLASYSDLFQNVKKRIQESRILAYRAVNKELIELYLNIGREIASRQEREGWGKSVVERLSHDLHKEFSGTSGFSSQNLWFMRQIYLEYNRHPNLLRLVREIPWGQNIS